jgi:hypothetical protein
LYADIELINGADLILAKRNIIGADEVKRIPIHILVDNEAQVITSNFQFPHLYSTVTLFAKLRGLSTSSPFATPT